MNDFFIDSAEYISDYVIIVRFHNGEERTINFGRFFTDSDNPIIQRYADKDLFRRFKVNFDCLSWGDNDVDISAEALFNDQI